jgi:hypothetical protein
MANLLLACNQSANLRISFPCKPVHILEGLRSVEDALLGPGQDNLPEPALCFLLDTVALLKALVSAEFEPEELVPERSDLYRKVIELNTYLDGLRRYLQVWGITTALPSGQRESQDLLQALKPGSLGSRGTDICWSLKDSLDRFESEQYRESLSRAASASKLLEQHFYDYIHRVFQPATQIQALHLARQCLWDKTNRGKGRGRLEWLVLPLVELALFFRHVDAHPENDPNIPDWMDRDRKDLPDKPALVRLALLCNLHAALRLQELWENLEQAQDNLPTADGASVVEDIELAS